MKVFAGKISFFLITVLALFILPLSSPAFADETLRVTLKNGLRVVIVPNKLAPVVTTEVNYLVGGNETPEGFPGMAHAEEHMMFRGSPGLSAGQLSTIIASLGGDFNADTQQTVTQYFFTVSTEDIDVALNVEAVRMRGILDTEELWGEERGAIEQEVAQDLSNPAYLFTTRLLEELYAGTPYARDALGTRESFQKTTGAMLKKFHEQWYAPNNAILVIVGDIDPPKVLEKVRQLFESIPGHPLPRRPEVKLKPVKPKMISMETDLPYGMAILAYRLPGFESPDFIAGQILADVLDSHRSNLYNMVVDGRAIQTGFDSSGLPKASSGLAVAAFPPGGDGQKILADMKKIINGYVKEGISADLTEAAKRHEIADSEFQKNSVPGLAALWSTTLAIEGRNSPEDDIESIKKVTAADVNRVAREYLSDDKAVTAILTPKRSGAPVSAREFKGPESFTPREVKPVELPVWAKKATAPPVLPAARPNLVDMLLPNGLRLIVKQEAISPTVTLLGEVKNEPFLQESQGKEGVSRVIDALFSYGTTSYDRLALLQEADDIAADLSAGTDFSLRVPSDRFDRGIALLADNLLNPAFPNTAFTIVRQETAAALKGEQASPSREVVDQFRALLYPENDPKKREATPESVSALTLDDVKSYYKQVFRPDMTTIVIVGRVTPEQAKSTVQKYFGNWKATGPKPETDLPSVSVNKPSGSVVPDEGRVQDEVRLEEVLEVTRSHPDYYALQVGNHILSGAFYATRLYRDLRKKAGLVYSVESEMEIGKTRSLFGVFYACDPANVSRARRLVTEDLAAMQKSLVTPEELRQAKTLLIRKIALSQASVSGVAHQLLGLVLEDLPLDEPDRAARRYLEITAEQVRDVFVRWIRPSDFVQVTLGPTPE